jgi:ribosomal-protein-alanine N-acetyltransferase
MVQRDLREVLRIEADSFGHPWSEQDFGEHLENPGSVTLVVEQSGLIVGYEVFGIGTPWIQLYSCVVRRTFRRRGIGSRMVTHVARLAAAHEPGGVLVKVPERNLGAQLFFHQCGFRAIKVLSAYLWDEQDAYVMKYSVPEWVLPSFDLAIPEDGLIPVWEVKHG